MARAATDTSTRRRPRTELAGKILDAALALAEDDGWSALRLRTIAERLDVPLGEILEHYRDLDAIADAWFQRAWHAMLQPVPEDFASRQPPERIEFIMMRWFDALAPHRRVTGQMLAAKSWYAHPHHWVPAIFNLSRTVLWLREAARLDATGRQRQVEETGLTALFLATLAVWLRDETEHQERTRTFLQHRLDSADRLMRAFWRPRQPQGEPNPSDDTRSPS